MKLINGLIPHGIKEYLKRKLGVPDMFVSLERLRNLGYKPRHIIDIGAFEGEWAIRTSEVFPEAGILMIEAMPQKQAKLQKVCSAHPNLSFEIALLGPEDGREVQFTELETASSVLEEEAATHHRISRTTTTLDSVLERKSITNPSLVKLDVQGYELEVLKGFSKYISSADVILTEASLLDIHKNVPLVKDVVNFLADRGFVLYDICSVSTRRPLDQALWQTDLLFVREDAAFRKDKRYSA